MRQVKSTLRVPYGLRDGKMYAAREVPAGLACGCICLGCQQPLVAKNHGKKVRPHFAHHVDRACRGAFESSIHRRAKELIVDKGRLMLPAWDGDETMPNPPCAPDANGQLHQGHRVDIPANMVVLTDACMEIQRVDYRPDVVAKDSDGDLLIEVRVTHAVGDQKTRNVRSDGYRMVEIDLSKITADQAEDPDLFEILVLNTASNRIWISHPEAADAWRRSREELKELIRAKDQLIAAARAQREKLWNENNAQQQAKAARKEQYRLQCRESHQVALAALSELTSSAAIEAKYLALLKRDRPSADAGVNRVTEVSARSYLRVGPDFGWLYGAHPYLWQTGAYLHFIEGKSLGQTFEQAALGRWVRATYGVDKLLWSLFRAQWVARHEALNRGGPMRSLWAWFFSPGENKRIPNFFEPIDEFVSNMIRCGVLKRDLNRKGWLAISKPRNRHPVPALPSTAQPAHSSQVPIPKASPAAVAAVMARSEAMAEGPRDRVPDPFIGKNIWHEDLGFGVVVERVVRCSPIYDVRFGDEKSRRILLRSNHRDWRMIDSLPMAVLPTFDKEQTCSSLEVPRPQVEASPAQWVNYRGCDPANRIARNRNSASPILPKLPSAISRQYPANHG